MSMPVGSEVYKVDVSPVIARGCTLSQPELDTALNGPVAKILEDVDGKAELKNILGGIAATSFAKENLEKTLAIQPPLDDWRVGESLAEAYLTEHKKCIFPWPFGRDQRNPHASPAGTDLVGFQDTAQKSNSHRFAFGEVKTSTQEAWPPNVMFGRSGLVAQLEGLRDSKETKFALLRYLTFKTPGAAWLPQFQSSARRLLENPDDVSLFGVLIRDVDHKNEDLAARANALAKGCPENTAIELRAVYLPKKAIGKLAKDAAAIRKKAR